MVLYSQIWHIEWIAPAALGVQLANDDSSARLGPILVRPADFIADFRTFLDALHAAGVGALVDPRKLAQSWRKQRRELRKQLNAAGRSRPPTVPPADLEGRLICGRVRPDVA